MRQMTETEIDAKLAACDNNYNRAKVQAESLETQAANLREEMARIQGEYRAWASLKGEDTKVNETTATEAASV